MQVIGFIMGILSILGMLFGLIPFLGWSNWLVIPFAGIGLIISIIGVAVSKRGGIGVIGIILCLIALFISIPRLFIGGGVF
jgi:hypothetical protein